MVKIPGCQRIEVLYLRISLKRQAGDFGAGFPPTPARRALAKGANDQVGDASML
jgi:hypothetical protein